MANISVVRGDTYAFKFQRKSNGQVIMTEPDNLYFTVKRNTGVENYIFQKTLEDMTFDENGWYHFDIRPADTNNMTYGNYVFDIEVKTTNYTKTICIGKFVVLEEVTFASNEE